MSDALVVPTPGQSATLFAHGGDLLVAQVRSLLAMRVLTELDVARLVAFSSTPRAVLDPINEDWLRIVGAKRALGPDLDLCVELIYVLHLWAVAEGRRVLEAPWPQAYTEALEGARRVLLSVSSLEGK